jgi:hypothetical protein
LLLESELWTLDVEGTFLRIRSNVTGAGDASYSVYDHGADARPRLNGAGIAASVVADSMPIAPGITRRRRESGGGLPASDGRPPDRAKVEVQLGAPPRDRRRLDSGTFSGPGCL